MHTIKITPNLLFEYQCASGKCIRLPNRIEKNRFGSENRIEWKLFLPELECSSQCPVVFTILCGMHTAIQLNISTTPGPAHFLATYATANSSLPVLSPQSS